MLFAVLGQSFINLQIYINDANGAPRNNISSVSVKIYQYDGAGKHEILNVSLSKDADIDNLWRYLWPSSSLLAGEYTAEYLIEDNSGMITYVGEDIIIKDIAQQSTLNEVRSLILVSQTDLAIIKKIETGRWRIQANQMVFYDEDGVTPFMVFDLKDDDGLPTMTNVFERLLNE